MRDLSIGVLFVWCGCTCRGCASVFTTVSGTWVVGGTGRALKADGVSDALAVSEGGEERGGLWEEIERGEGGREKGRERKVERRGFGGGGDV